MASANIVATPSSPKGTPTINNSTITKPLENADQKMKKPLENDNHNAASSSSGTTNKDDHHRGALSPSSDMIHNETPTINTSTKTKPLENHHDNAASSSATTTNKDDQQGEALSPSSERIRGDLHLVDSALNKYMDHMNAQINLAREEFEKLQKLGSSERDLDELRKAITKLKLQIPTHDQIKSKSKCSIQSVVAHYKAKFWVSEDKQLENSHQSAASSSATTNKNDQHGEALSPSSDMILNDLFLLNSALKKYMDHMDAQINEARQKFEELQKIWSKEKNFDKLRKVITDLQSQIPLTSNDHCGALSNKDDQHGEALPPSSEMIPDDLLHAKSALKEYADYMNLQINLAHEEFKELQKLGSSEIFFDELRKAIAKLKLQIPTQDKTKSKCSIRSLVANFKAKLWVSKDKQLENSHQNAASSSATTNKNDQHGEALSPSSEMIPNDLLLLNSALEKYMNHMNVQINQASQKFEEIQKIRSRKRNFDKLRKAIADLKLQIPLTSNDHCGALSRLINSDLLFLDSTFAEAKKYMVQMKVQIHQAHQKFEELQKLGSNHSVLEELRKATALEELQKATTKLKFQIPSQIKFHSADSNPRHNPWPNVNKAVDGMTHFFYKEQTVEHTGDGLLEAFCNLPEPLRHCLLCFFKFPPEATIKRTTMIYLWIGQGYTLQHLQGREEEELPREEDAGNEIFDELIEKRFIEPIYQNCSLVPDSCRMSPSVRSSLSKEAEERGFTSNGSLDLDHRFVCGDPRGHSCLINVGEAIINWEPQIVEKMKDIQSLYLGRWQSSATHHIELAEAKILHGLNKANSLKFLSLRGISLITKLPKFILELNDMKILDLQACHNLEEIPNNIGFLKSLTHLDMSECYFLEHMPKSLAQLSNLEVLKGFFIGEFKKNKPTCTLKDLSRLQKLRKLNIYTSVKNFPGMWDLEALKEFKGLQKLTISWGGRLLQGETDRKNEEDNLSADLPPAHQQAITAASLFSAEAEGLTLPPKLQKLDLQCFPTTTLPHWLKPAKLKELKKLYIRGGQLLDLGQFQKCQGEQWTVEILRFKYLTELELDWIELRIIFPKLIYLHQEGCPKFTNFSCDVKGVWTNKEAIDTHEQLQKYLRTSGMINSSSMSSS